MFRVVKLGGSLHDAPELCVWLHALARAGGRIVLVPGGGPHADAVRTAQARWGFSDAAAHRMSLLAMEQYGLMLCDLEPGLVPAASTQAIAEAVARSQTPVWLPSAMCLGANDIQEDWSVTSDSLSAWLAHHLGAEALALIKHGEPDSCEHQALADQHWVDAAFPAFAKQFGKPVRILGHHNPDLLNAWLAQPAA